MPYKARLEKLGVALHFSKSKRLIVKAEKAPPLFSTVYGPDMKQIGLVTDVFGPVKSPYVAVKLNSEEYASKYIGQPLFFKPPRKIVRRRVRKSRKRR